jgi:hypothetical protein
MPLRNLSLACSLLLVLGACPNPEEQFTSGRLLDGCDRTWPICTTTVGCIVGDSQYLEGRFPGTRRFAVRTEGQAEIAVALYLRTQNAVGTETRIEINEAGCGSKSTEPIDGRALFREFEAYGEVRRAARVFREGDHLIEVASDATADYLLKVEIQPLDR